MAIRPAGTRRGRCGFRIAPTGASAPAPKVYGRGRGFKTSPAGAPTPARKNVKTHHPLVSSPIYIPSPTHYKSTIYLKNPSSLPLVSFPPLPSSGRRSSQASRPCVFSIGHGGSAARGTPRNGTAHARFSLGRPPHRASAPPGSVRLVAVSRCSSS